jgi:short-subunit dehydrogenase
MAFSPALTPRPIDHRSQVAAAERAMDAWIAGATMRVVRTSAENFKEQGYVLAISRRRALELYKNQPP